MSEAVDQPAPSLYATVCVNTPLGRTVGTSLGADRDTGLEGRTFTYAVPEHLTQRLQPGHLVWVPFRSRRLQAVVLTVSADPPGFDTLSIEAVVWSQPVLTSLQIALAHWLSQYYLSPLIDALRMMLPARITQRGRTVLARTSEPAPKDLTPNQAALLAQIERGEGTWAEISEGLGRVTQKADLDPLIDRGLVTREVAFASPPPRPKLSRRVRLTAGPDAIAAVLPTLGHTSLEADILAWLAAQDDPRPLVVDLCRALGCTPARVGSLAHHGRFALLPARTLVRRCSADTDLPQVLAALGLSSKKAQALAALPLDAIDEAEFRTGQQVALTTLRALAAQGLAERSEEPGQVSLTIRREAVPGAILDLRGGQKQRQVLDALQRQGDSLWLHAVYEETGATADTLRDLEAAGLIAIEEEVVWRDPLAGQEFKPDQPPQLTPDQEHVWAVVEAGVLKSGRAGGPGHGMVLNAGGRDGAGAHSSGPLFAAPPSGVPLGQSAGYPGGRPASRDTIADYLPTDDPDRASTYLIYGVTGSGKTEIYLRAIAEVLKRGQQAIVLVPEIALTPQTVRRFAARFPGQVTVWHSHLSDGERFDVWRRIRTGHPAAQVVVGSRSALFLPYPNLGLIVVDEEHESSYKQERTPRYHARTVAIELGRLARVPVLLGSATPALETYFSARSGAIELLTLPRRVLSGTDGAPQGDLPGVAIVDMRQELRTGNRTMFSRSLATAFEQVLERQEQAILYLNRRGSATFVMCRDCGHVETCPRCAVPLTYHGNGNILLCHHCNRRYPVPLTCVECAGPHIRYFGSGTQNVEDAVKQYFPTARTLRWDRDVTGAKGSHDAILSQFAAHQADVLIGTQMIAKGLDLPLVTLVGVIAADTGLFLPDFRAGERTFQLLTQVAGRAGRSTLGGRVIIQTYHPEHYAIIAASHHDFETFYRQEMVFRREQGYPPLLRLARLVYFHSRRDNAQAEALRVAEELRSEIAEQALPDTDLIGPAPCFFSQQRGEYRWQIVVRSPDPAILLRGLALQPGWRMDIDPVDLL